MEAAGEPSTPTGASAHGRAGFATTRWTLVLSARESSEAGQAALEALCRTYWFPVYALVRRRGWDPEGARDATQEFFSRLLARDGLARVRRERGRFRGFLAQSVRNFLADEWDKARSQKRGRGKAVISLEAEEAEGRYIDVAHELSPDRMFDRQWAEDMLAEARRRLQREYTATGREGWLEVLDRVGDPGAATVAAEAERMGIPVNTLKSHLRRARVRQAEVIRELVAETVSTPAETEAELRHLLEALGS